MRDPPAKPVMQRDATSNESDRLGRGPNGVCWVVVASYSKGRLSRFLKLGGLTTKVGASYLGQKIKGAFVSGETKQGSMVRANIRNAARIARTLGELKGSVMKVGQMLSLQADVLPREMTEILSRLQKDAPPVSFDLISKQLELELEQPLEQAFAELDPQPYASASIGQVHRARLHDGREAVVKVQYPDVDRMVDSDLRNVRTLFKVVAQVKLGNMDGVFEEVRARMTEEVDYCNERCNLELFGELFEDDPRVIVPVPVHELTTRRVLMGCAGPRSPSSGGTASPRRWSTWCCARSSASAGCTPTPTSPTSPSPTTTG